MRKSEFPLGYQVSGNVQTAGYEKKCQGDFLKIEHAIETGWSGAEQASESDLNLLSGWIKPCELSYSCKMWAKLWYIYLKETCIVFFTGLQSFDRRVDKILLCSRSFGTYLFTFLLLLLPVPCVAVNVSVSITCCCCCCCCLCAGMQFCWLLNVQRYIIDQNGTVLICSPCGCYVI